MCVDSKGPAELLFFRILCRLADASYSERMLDGGTKERMLKDFSERMLNQDFAERVYDFFSLA